MSDFPCPKCERVLKQSGELTMAGKSLPSYQCDECLQRVDFQGEEMDLPLTFVVQDGKAIDPAAENGAINLDPVN